MRKRPAMQFDHARIRGHRIRYAVRPGDPARVPLLILNGIGANIELVAPFVDALAAPTIVTFDVPGVGGSPTPASPYRPSGVARLAESLLDHLGYDEADVLGVSWGGAIAQQFAFQCRARCRRLVLAATSPGALMVPAHPSVLLKMATPRRYLDKAHAHRIAGDVYGGVFRRDPQIVADTLRHVRFSSRGGYYLQLAAACGWTSLPVALHAASAHADHGRRRRSAGPDDQRARHAVAHSRRPPRDPRLRASVSRHPRRGIGAPRRIVPDGARG